MGLLQFAFAVGHAFEHGVEGRGQAADLVLITGAGAQCIVFFAGDPLRQLFQAADRPGDQAAYLAQYPDAEQQAAQQDHQAGAERTGIEGARYFATGHQEQVAGLPGLFGQGLQQAGAKLLLLPAGQFAGLFRQWQGAAALQLREQVALAVVQCGGAQAGIAIQVLQHGLRGLWRTQRLLAEGRAGDQASQGVQRLRGQALPGDPVGGTDERQVGQQQYGQQEHQQGCQQLVADRQVVEALTQLVHTAVSTAVRQGSLCAGRPPA